MNGPITIWESTKHNGNRLVRIAYEGVPPPAPRQNQRTRWGTGSKAQAAERYNDFRATLRDEIFSAMFTNGTKRFGKVPLECRVEVWYLTEKELRKCDLINVVKTVEDCLGRDKKHYPDGILIYDDRWIDEEHSGRFVGPVYRTIIEIAVL